LKLIQKRRLSIIGAANYVASKVKRRKIKKKRQEEKERKKHKRKKKGENIRGKNMKNIEKPDTLTDG